MRFTAALFLLLPLLNAHPVLAEDNAGAPAVGTASTSATPAAGAPTMTPASAAASAGPTDSASPDAATDTEADAPEPVAVPIYLVARIKLSGTDLTHVVFFQHATLNTLEACEIERNSGLTIGWNHVSLRGLKTPKGVAYKVDYLCVESERRLSFWNSRLPMDQFYLVRTVDKKLVVETQPNFFACRRALRERTREESIDAFCGLSSQVILTAPAPTAPASSTAPTPAPVPAPSSAH